MADRVAVFSDGKVMQVGSPEDIYSRPNTRFVADFVGSSNVLPPGVVEALAGQRRWASLRPEAIHVAAAWTGASNLNGTVVARSYLGSTTRLTVDLKGLRVNAVVPSGQAKFVEGDAVSLNFSPDALHLMEGEA